MITADQIRAARALLRLSARRLAEMAGLSLPTIQRMEAAKGVPSGHSKSLEAVENALKDAGIEFIDENGGGPGVRLKHRARP